MQNKKNADLLEEFTTSGAVFTVGATWLAVSYLSALDLHAYFLLTLPVAGYLGNQMGKKVAPYFFKSKTHPTEQDLAIVEQDEHASHNRGWWAQASLP